MSRGMIGAMLGRSMLVAVLAAGCYERSAATSCTLTCDPATPCPDDMFCGADQLCRGRDVASCGTIPPLDGDQGAEVPIDALLDSCPASYDITLPSTVGVSRYRALTGPNVFWAQEMACRNDALGFTHLVVTETVTELEEVFQRIGAPVNLACWVGAVQDPTSATPGAGWIRLDGVAVDNAQWRSGFPNDRNNTESDHEYNVGGFRCDSTVPRLIDNGGYENGITLCECDGKPIAQSAINFMLADPNRI